MFRAYSEDDVPTVTQEDYTRPAQKDPFPLYAHASDVTFADYQTAFYVPDVTPEVYNTTPGQPNPIPAGADIPGQPGFNRGDQWGKVYGNRIDAYGYNLRGGDPFLYGDYGRELNLIANTRLPSQDQGPPEGSALDDTTYPDIVHPFNFSNVHNTNVAPIGPQFPVYNNDPNLPSETYAPVHNERVFQWVASQAHEGPPEQRDSASTNNAQAVPSTGPSRPSRAPARPRPDPSNGAGGSRITSTGAVARLNKDGTPRKARAARPPLCKWTDEAVLHRALLGLVLAANEDGLQIDFDKAAKWVGVTGPAFQQALLKMQKKLAAKGEVLPPLKMNWKGKSPSLIVVLKGNFALE